MFLGEYVKALFDYSGKDNFKFNKGDKMKLVKRVDNNWWECELNGKSGYSPISYVELCKTDDSEDENVKFAEARWDYGGAEGRNDVLSFKKGDSLKIVNDEDSKFWKCELNGKVGLCPANYLKILSKTKSTTTKSTAAKSATKSTTKSTPKSSNKSANKSTSIKSSPKSTTTSEPTEVEYVECLFDLNSDAPNTISFKKGEQGVVQQKFEGWWKCKLGSRVGLCPADYLKIIPKLTIEETAAKSGQDTEANDYERAECLYDFAGVEGNPSVLPLKKGQIIKIISKISGGWYKIECDGKRGMCAETYIKILNKKSDSNAPNSSNKTSDSSNKISDSSNKTSDSSNKTSDSNSPASKTEEYVISLFDSEGVKNKPEFPPFTKGTIMKIIKKSQGGWWKCEREGQHIMCPENYLKVLTAEEVAASKSNEKK
jgi:hypothetical protein